MPHGKESEITTVGVPRGGCGLLCLMEYSDGIGHEDQRPSVSNIYRIRLLCFELLRENDRVRGGPHCVNEW